METIQYEELCKNVLLSIKSKTEFKEWLGIDICPLLPEDKTAILKDLILLELYEYCTILLNYER